MMPFPGGAGPTVCRAARGRTDATTMVPHKQAEGRRTVLVRSARAGQRDEKEFSMKLRVTVPFLLAALGVAATATAQAPAAGGGYKAKNVNVAIRDLGGSYSIKVAPDQKTVKLRQKNDWVTWTVQNVPRAARVRVESKDLSAPPVSCHAASATSWVCVSSTFFLKSDLGVPPAAGAARPKLADEKYAYNVILSVAGKDYPAESLITVQQ